MTELLVALLLSQVQPGSVRILDEGAGKGRAVELNCVGAGIACTVAGQRATLTVSGGGGGGATLPTTLSLLKGDNAGGAVAYGGTGAAPANQWLKSLTGPGVATWAQIDWADVSGKPTLFAPSSHTHPATDLTATGRTATNFLRGDNTWTDPPGTYSLPTAAAATLGGIKVGTGLAIDGAGVLSATGGGGYTLPAASTTLGGVKMAAACGAGNHVASIGAGGELGCTADAGGGGGAPTTATYITQTADAGLSAEQALSSLSTGIVKVTTGTGVLSTAASGTDYGPPTSGNATGLVISTTTTGAHTAYAGTSCTNQFPRSLNASGAATCAGIGVADFTANQGTTTQVLHGNAAGQPAWGAIVAGDLPTATVAKGGTGLTTIAANQLFVGTAADTVTAKTLTNCTGASDALSYNTTTNAFGCTTISAGAPSFSGLVAGGAIYADTTTSVASTAAGTAGWMSLHSGGTGAPTWAKSTAIVLTTAAWTSSATANALGIVGTGATPLTSPTYAAASPFGFRCQLLTTRPGTTNQPRYGIQSSGTVTAIDATAVIGLAGTAPARTTAMQDITTLATASCAAGCTANVVTGGAARTFLDTVEGAGVMNASGTLSLVMAPSAAATHTIKIGSNCVWF